MIFTCNDFEGPWPVGTAAVVIADSREAARAKLLSVLEENGLPQKKEFTLEPLNEGVRILCDGNY